MRAVGLASDEVREDRSKEVEAAGRRREGGRSGAERVLVRVDGAERRDSEKMHHPLFANSLRFDNIESRYFHSRK